MNLQFVGRLWPTGFILKLAWGVLRAYDSAVGMFVFHFQQGCCYVHRHALS